MEFPWATPKIRNNFFCRNNKPDQNICFGWVINVFLFCVMLFLLKSVISSHNSCAVTFQKLKNHKFLFYLKMKSRMKIFLSTSVLLQVMPGINLDKNSIWLSDLINLDKNSIWLWDLAPIYKDHTNLDFDAKHLKRGWKRVVKNFVMPFFSKKASFSVNIRCCPDILD